MTRGRLVTRDLNCASLYLLLGEDHVLLGHTAPGPVAGQGATQPVGGRSEEAGVTRLGIVRGSRRISPSSRDDGASNPLERGAPKRDCGRCGTRFALSGQGGARVACQ
jgi:hypothetical protein